VVGAKRDNGSTAASEAIQESVRLKLMIETLNLIDWLKDEESSQVEAKVAEGRAAAALANLLNAVALECLQEGILTCDAIGCNIRLNRSAQAIGATPSQVPLARTLAGERVRGAELNIGGRVVLANGQPVFSSNGEKLGAILSLHDITERQRTEGPLCPKASPCRTKKAISSPATRAPAAFSG